MDFATADGWEEREKMRKISGENIPDDDLRKNENKENYIHAQKILKEMPEKNIWKFLK